MKTDVSVIVPVYNGEKTIKKCIESILSQTLESIEVIVVNDGSTDSTAEILDGITDPRLKVISVENGGQGYARNYGIDAADGEYIGFADADDTVEPEMYKDMFDTAKQHGSDMVQCAINDITDGKTTVRAGTDAFVAVTDVNEYADNYFYTLKHTNEVCNKIFRKEFLEKAGLRFSDTREVYSEDLKFNIDSLLHLEKVSFVKIAYYNYFISDSGHCKKNPEERAVKIAHLYDMCLENIKNEHLANCIKSMAVINLFSYIAPFSEEIWARETVSHCRKKGYLKASARYKKTFKHTALMMCMEIAPYAVKKKILARYYIFDRKGKAL